MCLAEQSSAGRKHDFKRFSTPIKKIKIYTIFDVVLIESQVNRSSTSYILENTSVFLIHDSACPVEVFE